MGHQPTGRAEALALVQQMLLAAGARNAEGVLECYAEDAVAVSQAFGEVRGRTAVAATWSTLTPSPAESPEPRLRGGSGFLQTRRADRRHHAARDQISRAGADNPPGASQTIAGDGRRQNAERRTPNAERRTTTRRTPDANDERRTSLRHCRRRHALLRRLLERERELDQLRLAARHAGEADAERRRLGVKPAGNAGVGAFGTSANGTMTVG